ncbi:Protein kinase protein with adenine nucleotide alpha hydrolases-like domain [Striga hermonthica]|uniref:Protein kinase protein with adenine nucleotide alpha hydrolases-like domain n=1 Tax=Striga hermonthica TaxID=68872 RepID=A0A9N7R3W8_STRHE|nr:Protein kinase protein with adenine nucleotide alpha hydrolases-like domain [Striga hermonthica]
MTQMVVAGGGEGSGGRAVVVGVKLDARSRELLTWALVKVAEAGDRVVALHVLDNNEIVNRDGKSSLLAMVKAFDSILEVYEGFCNLKQVDLKLKICRGSSVPKILVREAKAYNASEVIVGTAHTHHKIRTSASVAKHCSKKLPKDCSILAVNNGKIVFHRESSSSSRFSIKEVEHHRRNRLLTAIQRSFSKNIKVLDNLNSKSPRLTWDVNSNETLATTAPPERNCSICSPDSFRSNNDDSFTRLDKDHKTSDDQNKTIDDSMAIVPVQKQEASSSFITLLLQELPETKPGWPLLRRAVVSNKLFYHNTEVRQMSVVQWALSLPNRYCLAIENSKNDILDCEREKSSSLDGENGAIVPVGNESFSVPISPDNMSGGLPEVLECLVEKYSATCRLFSFQELVKATSNFFPGNMIGKGGSSRVYRGYLPDGKQLAVKILKTSEDAVKEFLLEIEIITALHHKNIISLFGFCYEDKNLLLVYDFLSRGSLEDNLHGHKKEPLVFGWNERFRVAIGVAEALEYLHNRKEDQPVIHRDVKSSNILLSDDFEPQLSDFGLAKWASTTSTHITCTDVAGTFGYLAPEYFMYGKVNEKIDVYAYGVVLLELLSGRKPISNNCPKGHESLVMWAKPFLNSDKFSALLDLDLSSSYDHEQVERMVLAASLCIRRAPRTRPQMSLILRLLQGDVDVVNWARLQVNACEGSRFKLDDYSVEPTEIYDETFSKSNLQSHLNLALLGVDGDSASTSSIDQTISLEDYLEGRWSRSPSFD